MVRGHEVVYRIGHSESRASSDGLWVWPYTRGHTETPLKDQSPRLSRMVTQRDESVDRVELPVDIRLLGHLEVSDSSGSPIEVPGDRQRALLALLALAHPRPVTSSRLIEELWDGSDTIGETNLQVVVSRLPKRSGRRA